MQLTRSSLAIALCLSLSFLSYLSLPVQKVTAQDSRIALQRGYRTGYSDGYMAGYRDSIDNAARSYTRHEEYTKADRAYSKDYGTLENYRDGYQQGFESGYDTGYDKKSFNAVIPPELSQRGVKSEPVIDNTVATAPTTTNETPQTPVLKEKTDGVSYINAGSDIIVIPKDSELILELDGELSTERSKEGDKFTAKVVSPMEIAGAVIEGHVDKIQRPGRIKRRSELLLSFDRIIVSENRWSNFNGILTEVLPVKGDNVKRVDGEGTVEGKSSVKSDSIKVGASTGTGMVVGAVVGGPVGAAVGAGVGAAFGVGAVVVERGKHIKLNRLQQLRIRSSFETQIR